MPKLSNAEIDALFGIGPSAQGRREPLRALPSSSIGAGWGSGAANWQAGWGALLGALGADTEDFVRRKKAEAEFYQRTAPGATSFFDKGGVTDGGSLADWLAYNFGQSAPYMLEMLAGGVGGAALRGTRAAVGAAESLGSGAIKEQAAKRLLAEEAAGTALTGATERAALEAGIRDVAARYAAGAGAGLASYPSAVGDILSNQLEAGAAFDDMQLGTAMLGGIPYAALNLLGGEGAALRAATGGLGRRAGVDTLAETTGAEAKNILQRTLAGQNLGGAVARGTAKTGLVEGASETAQEAINQMFGRMAVDPNETLTSGDALKRYAESFMAGLGMGGIMGGGAHVFAKPTAADPETIAQRAEGLTRSLEQVKQGNETWRETLDTARAEEAEYLKEKQAAEQAVVKAEEDAFYAAVQREEDANKAKTEQIGALAKLVQAVKPAKQEQEDREMEAFAQRQIPDDLLAGVRAIGGEVIPPLVGPVQGIGPEVEVSTPSTTLPQLQHLSDKALETLAVLSQVEPRTKAVRAATKQAQAISSGLLGQLKAAQEAAAAPFEEGTLFNPFPPPPKPDLLGTLSDASFAHKLAEVTDDTGTVGEVLRHGSIPAPLRRSMMTQALSTRTKEAGRVPQVQEELELRRPEPDPKLNLPKERPLENSLQSALTAALKPLQTDQAWQDYLAQKEADRQVEIDAAYAQRGEQKVPIGKEQLGVQGDLIGYEGYTPEELTAGTQDKAVAETEARADATPDLTDVRQFITEGLQISAEWRKADAVGDEKAKNALRGRAMEIWDRMAMGFPKSEGTAEMFQWREGEKKPRITPAARIASGNWFKNPPKKETPNVLQETQAPAQEVTPPNRVYKEQQNADQQATDTAIAQAAAPETTAPAGATRTEPAVQAAESQEAEIDAWDEAEETLLGMGGDGATKSQFHSYAKKLSKRGLLNDGDLRELENVKRDRDMTADDMQSEIESALRNNRAGEEATNAVQEQAADEGSVQRSARAEDEIQSEAVGERDPQSKTVAAKGKGQKTVAEELAVIDARIADLEAKQDDEYLPGRADMIDKLYSRQALLQDREAGLRETVPVEEDEPVRGLAFGKGEAGVIADDTTPEAYELAEQPASTINPVLATRLRAGASAQQLLDTIAGQGGVAGVVARMLRQLGVDPEIKYVDEENRVPGSYSNGVVSIYRGGENTHTVLHEILHAASVTKLKEALSLSQYVDDNFNPTGKRVLTAEEKQLVAAMRKLGRLSEEVQAKFGSEMYAFKDVFEFVAEALSNPKLQEMMQQTPSAEEKTSPSMWQAFVSWLKAMFDAVESGSVMERFLEVVPSVLSSDMTAAGAFNLEPDAAAVNYADMPLAIGKGDGALYDAHSTVQQWSKWSKRSIPERLRRMGELVKDAIKEFNTTRGYAAGSYGGSLLVNIVSAMGQLKQRLLNEFNRDLAGFNALKAEDKRGAEKMLAFALELLSTRDTDAPVSKFAMGDTPMYEIVNGRAVINKDLEKLGILTKEEFIKGAALPARAKDVTFKFSEQQVNKWYNGYVSAAKSLQAMHAQIVENEILRAVRQGERDAAALRDALINNALTGEEATQDRIKATRVASAVMGLRDAFLKTYKDNLTLDSDGNLKLRKEYARDFEAFKSEVYGLVAGQKSADQIKTIATWTRLTPEQVLAQFEGLTYEKTGNENTVEGKKANALTNRRREYIKQFFANEAAMSDKVLQSKISAVESIVRGYLPMRRRGKYVIPMRYVTADGRDFDPASHVFYIGGDKKREVNAEAFLPLYASDSRADLQALREKLVDSLDGMELVHEYTDVQTGEPTKVTLKMVADPVVEMDKGHQLLRKYDYMGIMDALDKAGVTLDYPQRAALIKAATDHESRYRSLLKREGKLGFPEDYTHIIPEMMTGVASMIAIRRFAPEIDRVVADRNGEFWGGLDLTEAKKNLKEAVASGNKARISIAQRELDRMARFDATGRSLDRVKVREHFRKWANWVMETRGEEAKDFTTGIRAATTVAQLGGNFASAFINLTSIPLHGFNGLAFYNAKNGFGGGFGSARASAALIKASKALSGDVLGAAFKHFATGTVSDVEAVLEGYIKQAEKTGSYKGYSLAAWKFMLREMQSGVLQAQRYNETMSLAHNNLIGSQLGKHVARWMSMFSGTEEFNRMVMGIASYELFTQEAEASGFPATDAQGNNLIDEYATERAVNMIYDTQGEYTAANRPELFRNGVMSLMFMYKTFAITTVELLMRMPPAGRAVFLGSLLAVSGARGLPGYDEVTALLDFLIQKTGIMRGQTRGNVDSAFDAFLAELGLNRVLMNGILDTTLGTNVFGRAGVKLGVPGVGLLRDGASFFEEVGRTLGAPGGAIEATVNASGEILKGDVLGALRKGPVTGIKNVADAYTYASYGNVMNKRGQVVLQNPSAVDIMARVLGFYPEAFTLVNQTYNNERLVAEHSKAIHKAITEEFRDAYVLKDYAKMQEIKQAVQEMNREYRGSGLEFNDYAARLERAGKEATKSLATRATAALPKAQQKEAQQRFAEQEI